VGPVRTIDERQRALLKAAPHRREAQAEVKTALGSGAATALNDLLDLSAPAAPGIDTRGMKTQLQ